MNRMRKAKPFIKWAGGKGQLLDEIRRFYPAELGKSITKYAEPMVGGGAVFFDVMSNYPIEKAYISDTNGALIHAYVTIRDNLEQLLRLLQRYEAEYLNLEKEQRKAVYYSHRERYNDLIKKNDKSPELAAHFIFLNRTCFNGLYRVNAKGEFNVPIGEYKRPTICDEENLRNVSALLQNVQIVCADYRASSEFINENSFVYFDPPYRPLPNAESFTAYTPDTFDDAKQEELADYIISLSKRGAVILASNSDPKNTAPEDNFFDDLYRGMQINRISATRMINSKATERGKISELLFCSKGGTGMERDFDTWMKQFRVSISGFDYYVDFQKVIRNVEQMKIELNIMNALIGAKDIETQFGALLTRYPEILKCIPLLLAVRGYEIYVQDNNDSYLYRFDRMNYSVAQYQRLMRETGLFDMISNHIVNNLVDYAYGVETGIDSNGRKNRGGHAMENLVEQHIQNTGFVKDETYFKEMYLSDIEARWGLDLSALSNDGKTKKRFDFVVKTPNMVYGIETNFYGGKGGGSKLNETARSYKMLAQEAKETKGFTFVWFTDGTSWNSAKGNLRETYEVLDTIYNIEEMERGIMKELFV